MTEYHCF